MKKEDFLSLALRSPREYSNILKNLKNHKLKFWQALKMPNPMDLIRTDGLEPTPQYDPFREADSDPTSGEAHPDTPPEYLSPSSGDPLNPIDTTVPDALEATVPDALDAPGALEALMSGISGIDPGTAGIAGGMAGTGVLGALLAGLARKKRESKVQAMASQLRGGKNNLMSKLKGLLGR